MIKALEITRQTEWFAVGLFCTVALSAITGDILNDDILQDMPKAFKWGTLCISIGIATSGLAFLAHFLAKEKFVGTPLEGGLALVTFGILAAAMPAIMDPDNDMAMERVGTASRKDGDLTYDAVAFPNLYFPYWFALIASLIVLERFIHFKFNYLKEAGHMFFAWGGLAAASLVVMSASSRIGKDLHCVDHDNIRCSRVQLGVALGVVSGFICVIFMVLDKKIPMFVDEFMAFALLASWTIGLIYINFGEERIAPYIGNLYFATYAGLMFSGLLFSEATKSLAEFMTKKDETEEEKKEETDEEKKEGEQDEEAPATE